MDVRLIAVVLALGSWGCAGSARPVVTPTVVTYEQKLGWILSMEDARVLQWGGVPAAPAAGTPGTVARGGAQEATPSASAASQDSLLVLLADPDARIRRRAAIALGRVGLPEGVPALIDRLEDADSEVRQAVAFALGLSGDGRAVEPLSRLLSDADPLVQGRAAEALGLLDATAAAPAIGTFVAGLVKSGVAARVAVDDMGPQLPQVEALRLAIFALVRLKAFEPLGGAVLDPRGEPLVRWWPVSYGLQRLEDPRALTALRTLATEEGSIGVSFAVRGLGALKDTASVDLLLRLVGRESTVPGVQAACVRALAAIGDARAVPVLVRLLATHTALDRSLVLEIVSALGQLGSASVSEPLMDLVGERWPPLRAAVLTALAAIDPFTFTTVLSGLDEDRDWTVRAAIATASLQMEPALAAARLRGMLNDEDARVLPAVLRALARSKADDLLPIIEAHLQHEDVVVRMVAAQIAGEQKLTSLEAALRAAYERSKADDTYLARAAALVALADLSSSAEPLLEQARSSDPDWAVRVRAAAALRGLGRTDVVAARPAPTRLRRDEYGADALVAPPFSPHVFLETDDGVVELELAVLDAPLTVANFMALARQGFYDGRAIHRVVPNFVVQDGDPRGDGEGGPGYTIRDELSMRPYLRGTVGMALDWHDTGGSQFFITHSPQPHLDGRYTVFGQVVSGMDVVDRLAPGDVIRRVRVWDGVEP